MVWVWCDSLTSWVAQIGPVPVGWVYPANDSNDPDLSTFLAPLGAFGEIDLFSAAASFDPCTFDYGTDHAVYKDAGGPRWEPTTVGGTAPSDTHLYVIVSGPNYDNTDPEPTWEPGEALTGPPQPLHGVTSTWAVAAVDAATGGSPVTLSGVAIQPVAFPLNAPATVDLEVLTSNSTAVAEFLDETREVQISRDGDVLFWGPVVRAEIDDDRARIQCADPRWYLTRRFFGKADRTNLLSNGDFEEGTTGWAATGLTPVIDPGRYVHGTRSVRLIGTAADHDNYLSQTYTHTHQFSPEGDELTIAAEVWVSSADYAGDAGASLGLFAERHDSGGTLLDIGGDQADDHPALINAALAKDQWVHLETTMPGVREGDTIKVFLYPPFGTAWWDLVSLTLHESLSFLEQDMATIIRGIVSYAQGGMGFSHGKSDLGIVVAAAPTGVTLSRSYQFDEHQNIGDALDEFTRRRLGVDFTFDQASRTLTATHPQAGTTHTDLTLEYGVNLTKFRWSHDRTQKADQVVVLGPGDGPDREEGGATGTPSGPTLEDVTVAPDGTTVAELDQAATERLTILTHPEILEVTCVGVIGILNPGDWVPVTIAPIGLDTVTYRAMTINVDPANDSADVTLNLRDPETPEEAMARFPRAVDACLAPGGGVWVVGSDGGVGAYGGATFHGSLPDSDIIPNAPIAAIVPHGSGGYWLVGADTGVFAYGDAPTRLPYDAMVDTEYARGDRAIVAAEAYNPDTDDSLIMLADDGDSYIAATP